ncbi:hypothetical protein AVEN_37061-1 [Araneus ventricosus]|uniref:Uncharacterized protein n=1 Tax=Araneus ventricosus TaxID=182803 RepID=A0A4Y2TTT2_ARAVE|nr:hypothetical protein AVEN_250654-1 [Araneus ventricosus]GBO02566.1 hypothetical protein AVEN_204594-1 [Araneus ventricosus]GBO02586.1 hypothetical protein AVEN_32059-1 [Araneus ventricosus]GBO02589.1 hypothetical protein AVEN_37061-1 [Araneus ventricosus]
MQNGAPPHVHRSVKQVLRQSFTNERVISPGFPTAWPPRSPDLTPCDFWLWGFIKDQVYRKQPATVFHLKGSVIRHIVESMRIYCVPLWNTLFREWKRLWRTTRLHIEIMQNVLSHCSTTYWRLIVLNIFCNKSREHDPECLSSKFQVNMSHTTPCRAL